MVTPNKTFFDLKVSSFRQMPLRRSPFARRGDTDFLAFSIGSVVISSWQLNCFVEGVRVSERLDTQFQQILEPMLFVVTGPTLLCAYVVAAWALGAKLNVTSALPWPTGPLSNWMIWLVLAVILHTLTSKTQAYLNRSGKHRINQKMNEDLISALFGGRLAQGDDKQLEPAWTTASPALGARVR